MRTFTLPEYEFSRRRPGYRLIYRATVTRKDGTKLKAADYGLRGFPIWVPVAK